MVLKQGDSLWMLPFSLHPECIYMEKHFIVLVGNNRLKNSTILFIYMLTSEVNFNEVMYILLII